MPKRFTNSEIKARLIFVVGCALAVTFVLSTATLLYGLLFVTQPLEVSPNDSSAWDLLKPMMLFLTGSMTGLLSANGLKDKDKDQSHEA
ncbi:hypothetical protein UFOVP1271_3 [uncultured Caudovirales phage]|uniref:Uncharacterized protein n=1 Tax=uncultured Caudovirales phage TaxID=2100421 RepID=A0A6J5RCD7_9CAUD|nr:hypothetical protein UFOVP1271_3 [uncultured Caudovirales phage]